MNAAFRNGIEKKAKFNPFKLKHEVRLDKATEKFLADQVTRASEKVKPRIGPASLFGASLIASLGLASGNYLASLIKKPIQPESLDLTRGFRQVTEGDKA